MKQCPQGGALSSGWNLNPGGKSQQPRFGRLTVQNTSDGGGWRFWGGGWQGTPGLKTLFRFDLLVVHECYLWQFYFPHVFHQNNLIFKKKSLK